MYPELRWSGEQVGEVFGEILKNGGQLGEVMEEEGAGIDDFYVGSLENGEF